MFAQRYSLSNCKPRTPSVLGLFPYDGNIIGGAVLGFGMALTGACPGTVLPQLATGIPSATYVLLGHLLGGAIYSKLGRPLVKKHLSKEEMEKPTIYEKLGTGKGSGLLGFEALCWGFIAAASYFSSSPKASLVNPIVGGLLIGGSQLTSLALTGNTLGISTAYEQVGDLFWYFTSALDSNSTTSKPSIKSTAFALGTILGSFALLHTFTVPAPVGVQIGKIQAVVGGVLLIFGSRLAGGCTSGHGISGMAMLSTASVAAVAAMFAGGMGLSALIRS